jgi:hypothetical protein
MTSLVRHFLSSILCCVIVFGHAPVWMHVASCGGHDHSRIADIGEGIGESLQSDDADCSHCCGHHHDQALPGSPIQSVATLTDAGCGSHDDHDSENCVVCQTLAAPCGVAWELSTPLVTGSVLLSRVLPFEPLFPSASLSIAHPRGPPMAV